MKLTWVGEEVGGEKCGGDDGGGGMSRRVIIQFWVVPEGVLSPYNKSWKQKKKRNKETNQIFPIRVLMTNKK